MFHKTNGTNEKVVPQGFILALVKNNFSTFNPSKLGKTPNFRVFSWILQTCACVSYRIALVKNRFFIGNALNLESHFGPSDKPII